MSRAEHDLEDNDDIVRCPECAEVLQKDEDDMFYCATPDCPVWLLADYLKYLDDRENDFEEEDEETETD